jgi:hypothetical protein
MRTVENNIIYNKSLTGVQDRNLLFESLSILKQLENQSLNDSIFISFVADTFGKLKDVPINDKIYYVHRWVNENIEYVHDDFDETIISPRLIIHILKGDCDDFALLIKTILKSLNVNANYILLGKEKYSYTHIAVVYKGAEGLIYIDGIMKDSEYPKLNYPFYKIIG